MYLHITGVTTWGAAVDIIIEAQHRWPVDERGRVDLTPPDGDLDQESWLIVCEPAFSLEMSYLCGDRWDDDDYELFLELTVREASPDRVNQLIGAPQLPGFELT